MNISQYVLLYLKNAWCQSNLNQEVVSRVTLLLSCRVGCSWSIVPELHACSQS